MHGLLAGVVEVDFMVGTVYALSASRCPIPVGILRVRPGCSDFGLRVGRGFGRLIQRWVGFGVYVFAMDYITHVAFRTGTVGFFIQRGVAYIGVTAASIIRIAC